MTVTPNPESVTGDAQGVTPAPVTVTDASLRRVAEDQGITVTELVTRLRDVASTHAADASLCPWCEGPMPAEVTAWQRYCSRNCSKEASRYRITQRRDAATAAAQRGIERYDAAHAPDASAATKGVCDACGRGCDAENALCDACMDDLTDQSRATSATPHTDTDTRQENPRG